MRPYFRESREKSRGQGVVSVIERYRERTYLNRTFPDQAHLNRAIG
ncbi:MAG: hypothetical protein Q4C47_08850 [Planctomycetia bacterium]|nr:hypothetical protein [Planctomycetia bacterium]